jgi:U3 small nucleolar RNA-associated protein 20
MLNIKYEHRDGRRSAIRMVSSLVDRLPLELVDNNIQLIFLPLVLQLVNDDAEDCRKAVSACLERIACRVSGDVASSLYDYNLRWYKGDNASLRRASLQLFGIFAEGRNEILAQNTGSVMACLRSSLESEDSDWEQHYFSLVSVEKVVNKSSVTLEEQHELWSAVVSELSHPHLWVRMTASRVIGYQLAQIDPKAIDKDNESNSFLVVKKGSLYDLASNFCGHLDAEESNMSTELSELAIKSLTWIALAMESNPELCYADGEAEGKEPVKWLINRLSGIARRKGTLRRQGVFKCFAALFHAGGSELVLPYLHLIIEPLYRAMLEAAGTRDTFGSEKFSKESDLAKEVLGMFEESCGDVYLTTLASVKVQARERRDKRKDKLAAEAVADPAAFATKKIHKQVREKHRRKRRVEEHRNDRGARAKRRTL